ncbi:MAG TPA: hypothetical protein PLH92_14245, partial [Mycobacterium sp.]|nr:hypothetical protein [Mycobacterium sp.]
MKLAIVAALTLGNVVPPMMRVSAARGAAGATCAVAPTAVVANSPAVSAQTADVRVRRAEKGMEDPLSKLIVEKSVVERGGGR